MLTLDKPIAHNDGSVKVTYDKPGSGAVIEDANGNEAPGFTDQPVTNNSLIPRVSIEALFPDASPVIANPAFKFTRSNTGVGSLRVALEMSQADNHMSSTLYLPQIAANNTTVETIGILGFVSNINTINTDSTVTLTVVGGDDHLPALAPNNSATVLSSSFRLRAQRSRIEFQEDAYTIDEGIGQFSIGIGLHNCPGRRGPQASFRRLARVAVLTEAISGPTTMLSLEEDSATINTDYTHISTQYIRYVYKNDWTCIPDQGCTHAAYVNVPILEDDKHERDEKFRYYLGFDSWCTHSLSKNMPRYQAYRHHSGQRPAARERHDGQHG